MTGAELKRRREALGMTQAQLGEALGRVTGAGHGWHWNTVARWESETLKPSRPGIIAAGLDHLEAEQRKAAAKHRAAVRDGRGRFVRAGGDR